MRPAQVAMRALLVTLIDRRLRDAKLEHRARFVPSGEAGDGMIDILEIEGGVAMSIRLQGKRFGVVRYHHDDDGEMAATQDCGWFDTPSGAAVRVVAVLRQATVRDA